MGLIDIVTGINWVDVLALILLFRTCYVSFNRGLSKELLPLVSIFTVLITSIHGYKIIGPFVAAHSPLARPVSNFVSFISLALIIHYIFKFTDGLFANKKTSSQMPSIYNRLSGLIAGVVRGILFVCVILTSLQLLPITYIKNSVRDRSLLAGMFIDTGTILHRKVIRIFKVL